MSQRVRRIRVKQCFGGRIGVRPGEGVGSIEHRRIRASRDAIRQRREIRNRREVSCPARKGCGIRVVRIGWILGSRQGRQAQKKDYD